MTPEEELAFLKSRITRLKERVDRHKSRAAKFKRMAMTDKLSGAGSRYGFEVYIRRLRRLARREGKVGVHAILYIDGNGFRHINNEHGYEAGDAVIVDMAQKLERLFRHDSLDYLARQGGDEFILVLHDCPLESAMVRAGRVREVLNNTPCTINGVGEIRYSCAVGCAVYRTDRSAKAAIKRAATEMRAAKLRRVVVQLRATG